MNASGKTLTVRGMNTPLALKPFHVLADSGKESRQDGSGHIHTGAYSRLREQPQYQSNYLSGPMTNLLKEEELREWLVEYQLNLERSELTTGGNEYDDGAYNTLADIIGNLPRFRADKPGKEEAEMALEDIHQCDCSECNNNAAALRRFIEGC